MNKLTTFQTFIARRNDTAATNELLAAGARFQTLGGIEQDRAKVLESLKALQLDASSAQPLPSNPEALLVKGTNAQGGGILAVFHFDDRKISLVQVQATAMSFPAAAALKLTPQLKDMVNNALARKKALVIAHVDAAGQPVLSFRGSLQTLSDTQFGMWIRNPEGGLVSSIAERPKVALMYRDWDPIAQLQFQGTARIATDEAQRQRVYDLAPEVERNHDFAKLGVAVIIDLQKVEGFVREGADLKIVMIKMSSEAA